MPVPDYQSLMLPCLKAFTAHKEELTHAEVRELVVISESLTDDDLREMISSGTQSILTNRLTWAVTYMKHAGLLERVRRGVYRLTEEGKDLLSRSPPCIDNKLLEEYPDFIQWRQRSKSPSSSTDEVDKKRDAVIETPEETLSRVTDELNNALKVDVLDRVRNADPSFLERVVVGLLIRMGYGGGDPENGRVTGGSGDGGIDGTIREDALGLDEVYVQAKKYTDRTVGEPELRNFVGAMVGTTKGVFVTTSVFTKQAVEYVGRSEKRIILIDGEKLAQLMVKHGIGVRTRLTCEIKRVDEDWFDQEAL